MAGARPKRIPVASEITRVKAKSRRSIVAWANRGTLAGPAWARMRMATADKSRPKAPPPKARRMLSVRSWATMRAAARTQRGTQGDLFTTGSAAREEEVGDIHARHEQEAPHGGHQHPKRAADAAHQFLVQDEDGGAPAFIQVGQGLLHPGSQGIEFEAHLVEGAAAARDHGEEADIDGARIAGVEGQGEDHVDARLHDGKIRRQYAYDGVGLVAQADGLARDGRVGGETALPQGVARAWQSWRGRAGLRRGGTCARARVSRRAAGTNRRRRARP